MCRYAPALVHVPVQPGGVRGGRVPALARGRDRRLPRQGRGAVPGECSRRSRGPALPAWRGCVLMSAVCRR